MPWVWAWPANQRAAEEAHRKSQLRNAIIFGLLCLLFLTIGAVFIALAIVYSYDDFVVMFWIGIVLGIKALLMAILFVFYLSKYKSQSGPQPSAVEMQAQHDNYNNQNEQGEHYVAELVMAPPTVNAIQ